MPESRIVIIIPVLNDKRSLAILHQELSQELADRASVSMLVVDDGSLPPIETADFSGPGAVPGKIITLTRNLGHQRAIAVGLAYAVSNGLGDIIAVMDADGEDKPRDVPRIVAAVESGPPFSVAVAQRTARSESVAFKFFYQLYRLMFLAFTGHGISFGNFSAMSLEAARRLIVMNELWLSFPATIIRSGLPALEVPTERGRRYRDRPQMNFVSLVILGFGAVAVFIERALTRVIVAAAGLVCLCILASLVATGFKLIGMASPGWVTTVIGISLILMVGVGILSFIGLVLRIVAGSHTIPAPSALYQSFIAGVAEFGPSTMDASPVADRGQP